MANCEDLITTDDLAAAKIYANKMTEFVESSNNTMTTPEGKDKLTITGAGDIAKETVSLAVSSAGYTIVGDFSDSSKVTITSDNQVYTSKLVTGSEDALWRTNQVLPYTPTGADPTSGAESGKWVVVAQGELKSIARSLNALNTQVIYSTDTTTVLDDVLYIYDTSEQITYAKPANVGIGEVIVSVGSGVLTTDGGAYQLESANKYDLKMTLSEAAMDKSLLVGDSIRVTDRASGIFKVTAGALVDGFGIIDATASGFQLAAEDKTGDIEIYGAVAGTDVTDVVQYVADLLGLVSFPLNTPASPFIIRDVYTNKPTVFTPKSKKSFLQMGTPSFVSASMIYLNNNSCYWDWGLKVDGNGQSRSAIYLSDGSDYCEVNIDATNINADSISATNNAFPAALNVGAVDRLKFSARGRSFENTGHGNESVPRVVTLRDGVTNFEAGTIRSENVGGSTILASTSTGTIQLLDISNAGDNGLYLGGGDVFIGSVVYRGSQEALVALGGATVNIGTLSVSGEGSYAVNLQDHKSVEIGTLILSTNDAGESVSGIMRTRNGNISAGSLKIGSIMGELTGSRLIAFDTGTIESVSITSMNVEFNYDSTKVTAPSLWANFNACKEVNIGRMDVKVNTTTLESSVILELKGLGNLVRPSYLENLMVYYCDQSGARDALGFFRGDIAVENMRGRSGSAWRTSIGPFVREVSDDWADGIVSGGVPAGGYWYKGADLPLCQNQTSPFRARCTESGAPGTWVSY